MPIPLNVHRGEIRFQDVSFHYENRTNLFENLTVTLNPGEKVGLVGYSGGDKSTFIKLILRLIDIQQGHIFIDNQDINGQSGIITISNRYNSSGT